MVCNLCQSCIGAGMSNIKPAQIMPDADRKTSKVRRGHSRRDAADGDSHAPDARLHTLTRDTVFQHLRERIEAVKLLDRNGRIVFANKACRALLGEAVANGRHWWDFWPSESHPQFLDALKRALLGEEVSFTAFRHTFDRPPGWWSIQMRALADEAGEPELLFVVSRDVTPRVGAQNDHQRF